MLYVDCWQKLPSCRSKRRDYSLKHHHHKPSLSSSRSSSRSCAFGICLPFGCWRLDLPCLSASPPASQPPSVCFQRWCSLSGTCGRSSSPGDKQKCGDEQGDGSFRPACHLYQIGKGQHAGSTNWKILSIWSLCVRSKVRAIPLNSCDQPFTISDWRFPSFGLLTHYKLIQFTSQQACSVFLNHRERASQATRDPYKITNRYK